MRLLLSHVALAVTMVQMGHALPQSQASQDGEAVGHIVVLKEGLNEDHLNEHLDAVKGMQKRSKRDDTGETGVKHVVDGDSYGFQGYTGVFTSETLEYIKAHEHVDYVEEDSIIAEPPIESREVSATTVVDARAKSDSIPDSVKSKIISGKDAVRIQVKGVSKSRTLFRGDTRPPDIIFKEGFQARGKNLDLNLWLGGSSEGGYVSTSRSFKVASSKNYALGGAREEALAVSEGRTPVVEGYTYQIDPEGLEGIWMMSAGRPNDPNLEFAVIGEVPAENIRFAYKVTRNPDGTVNVSKKPFMENKDSKKAGSSLWSCLRGQSRLRRQEIECTNWEISAADLVPVDESADTDTANVAAGSAGGLISQKSTIGGTLSWGQGYSTLLGKGLRLDVVVPLSYNAKRNDPAVLDETNPVTVLNETNPAIAFNFTAPSADMTGIVNLEEYFAEPDPDTIFDNIPDAPEAPDEGAEANGKRAVVDIPGCTGKINTHFKLAEDYDSYMHALDVSASLAISGWGQSAAVSGNYLDQAKMSNDALTFVATIEIEKQQDYENGRFHAASYTPAQFHQTHGDRWVKGYRRGGKLMARLIFTAKDSSDTTEVKVHAEAALRFWGVSGDVSVSVKNSMEKVDKHADVDITLFQEGNLGTFMTGTNGAVSSDKSSLGSASGSFKQVKEWADQFMQQACNHDFAYRPVLEEYTTLPGFPADQTVHDYGIVRSMSNRILRELVKLSELVTTVTRRLENLGGWEEHIDYMDFEFLDVVSASKQWVERAAADPSKARPEAKQLMVKFRRFNRPYKKYLSAVLPPDPWRFDPPFDPEADISQLVPAQ